MTPFQELLPLMPAGTPGKAIEKMIGEMYDFWCGRTEGPTIEDLVDDILGPYTSPSPPSWTRLFQVWRERFPNRMQEIIDEVKQKMTANIQEKPDGDTRPVIFAGNHAQYMQCCHKLKLNWQRDAIELSHVNKIIGMRLDPARLVYYGTYFLREDAREIEREIGILKEFWEDAHKEQPHHG